MAVLSAESYQEDSYAREWSFPLAASAAKIWKGAMVMGSTTTGLAEVGSDTVATYKFLGVALETVDNSSGAASATKIKVRRRGICRYPSGSTAATRAAFVNLDVYIYDDNHVDLVGVTTYDVKVGRCIDIDAQGYLVIDMVTS